MLIVEEEEKTSEERKQMKRRETIIRVLQAAQEDHERCLGAANGVLGPDGYEDLNGFDSDRWTRALDVNSLSACEVKKYRPAVGVGANSLTYSYGTRSDINSGVRDEVDRCIDDIGASLVKNLGNTHIVKAR